MRLFSFDWDMIGLFDSAVVEFAVLFLRAFWTFEHEFSTPFLVTSLPVSQRDPGQQH